MGEVEQLEAHYNNRSSYANQIATGMVILAEVVELAINMRDMAVIAEMRKVCGEIFTQAETILEHDDRNIQ